VLFSEGELDRLNEGKARVFSNARKGGVRPKRRQHLKVIEDFLAQQLRDLGEICGGP
jgi:hypothetical protein